MSYTRDAAGRGSRVVARAVTFRPTGGRTAARDESRHALERDVAAFRGHRDDGNVAFGGGALRDDPSGPPGAALA